MLLPSLLGAALAGPTFFVRPNGAGATGRTVGDAFGSIEVARDAIRALPDAAFTGDVTVLVLPGTYRLSQPVVFDSRDSGRNGHRVLYRGSDPLRPPTLSGGESPSLAWQPEAGGVFAADVGERVFRQLYVGERRATLARTPNADAPEPWLRLKQWEPGTKSVRLNGTHRLSKAWKRPEEVEFVTKHHWSAARLHLGYWDTYDGDDVFFPPEKQVFTSPAPKEKNQVYRLENAREFLDQPGEWYLDPSVHRLYYWPRKGERLPGAAIVLPKTPTLIDVRGTREAPIRNLGFASLRFAHTGWLHRDGNGTTGYVGAQGHLYWDDWRTAPAAVEVRYAEGLELTRNRFENLGGAGLKLVQGTHRTRVEGNRFSEIGDCGIEVYTEGPVEVKADDADQSRDDVISSNLIERTGTETLQATGMTVVNAQRIRIEHNEVRHVPSGGIVFGYFSNGPSLSLGNVIRANYVHHALEEVDDDGGIYVYHLRVDQAPNPPENRLLIARNLVTDIRRGPYQDANPFAGIYVDEGARGLNILDNVVRDCTNSVHFNTWSGEPKNSKVARLMDADPQIEAEAGIVTREFLPAVAPSQKPVPRFAPPLLLKRSGALEPGAKLDLPSPGLGEAFTLSSRVRLEPPKSDVVLFANHDPDWNGFGFRVGIAPDGSVVTRSAGNGQGHDGRTYPGAVPFGRPCRVTVEWERYGAAVRVFVDGVDVTRDDHSYDAFPNDGPLTVGSLPGGGQPIKGEILEVKVYAGKLRPTELAALANHVPKTGPYVPGARRGRSGG